MLDEEEIISIINAELSSSIDLVDVHSNIDWYDGTANKPHAKGRSKIVSTDIADSVEWIMPQIMKAFTHTNEMVKFDPIRSGDEVQAQLESEYVYQILMKQNNGFIVIHNFAKDCLLHRNGVLKVYYAKSSHTTTKTLNGVPSEQLEGILAQDGIGIVNHSERVMPGQVDPMTGQPIPVLVHDVTLSITREKGKIYVDSVPINEFKVNASHNSVSVADARFTAHITTKTAQEIIEEFDLSYDVVKEFSTSSGHFDTLGSDILSPSEDDSQKEIDVVESYIKIDIEGNGIAKLCKITSLGYENVTEILDIEEIDSQPWVTGAAILMSHQFEGRSIVDRIKELQDNKTALIRGMMDNMYLQNNQRTAVLENQVNLDDLLVSRPGGIVRVKRLDAIQPLITPQLGQDSFNMLTYLDTVRAGRTGVDAEGPATPDNIGDRVGSEGVARLMNAKEELVGLIIRVMLETAIKPLCFKIRDLARQHTDAIEEFNFQGQWHEVNPQQWEERTSATVRIGTGTGDTALQLQGISQVLTIHEKLKADPSQTLMTDQNVYAALDDLCRLTGLNNASKYFVDPSTPPGKQLAESTSQASKARQQEEKQTQMTMLKAQVDLSQAELIKAQAQTESVNARREAEMWKAQVKTTENEYKARLESLKIQLDEAKAIANKAKDDESLRLQDKHHNDQMALELTRIEATSESEQNKNFNENRSDV